jgi:hypothetical protein
VRECNAKIISCITPSPNLSPKGERRKRKKAGQEQDE